jgi:hypothetical protein
MASAETSKQDQSPHGPSAQSFTHSTAAVTQEVTTVESSELATPPVTFTQQESPLLRLPAELKNRIHGEVFRSFFVRLEERRATREEKHPFDPKDVRPLLCNLIVCRRFYQEAMPLLFRDFVATKPYWRLEEQTRMSGLLLRTTSFCQTMKRYAPYMRFSIMLPQNRFFTDMPPHNDELYPEHVKLLFEELASQLQENVILTFQSQQRRWSRRTGDETSGELVWKPDYKGADATSPEIAAWNKHLTSEDVWIHAKGSVGQYRWSYTWVDKLVCMRGSEIFLDECLAQLDWNAVGRIVPYH